MWRLTFERSSLAQTALFYAVTLASAVLLGLVLAFWTWTWFAPRPAPKSEPAARRAVSLNAASTLFGNAPPRQAAAAPTGVAIRLFGVAAASGNRRGYAVVQFDANQILAVEEGDDIAPGIRLAEVHADHVVLERGGVREKLAWPRRQPAANPGVRTTNQ